MGLTPEIPDDTPHEVGGWTLDPEPYNGLPWFGDDRRVSVLVREGVSDSIFAKVRDERVSGSYQYIFDESGRDFTLADGIERAVEWMKQHDPSEWQHPRVEPSVFEVPDGYSLSHYGFGEQTVYIRYERESYPEPLRVLRIRVDGYDGTDNWTVEIARHPITRGHGEVIWDPEKGTSLGKVLARARRVAAAIKTDPSVVTEPDYQDLEIDEILENAPTPSQPETGQTELAHFGEG